MTTAFPTTFRATLGNKILSRSPQLFDSSLQVILQEVLQNARRADATAVAVHWTFDDSNPREHAANFTITDNGSGVADPRILLTFGSSGWDAALDAREQAAGMGFYSLARIGCTVRSRDWSLKLTPAHFVGELDAHVEPAHPVDGTWVSFRYRVNDPTAPFPSPRTITEIIDRIVAHYPVPTTVNGMPARQSNFLADAKHVVAWEGLRIGVFTSRSETRFRPTPAINFHGVVLHSSSHGSDPLQLHHTAEHSFDADDTRHAWTQIDVVDCPALQLVLPSRNSIAQTPFLDRLRAEAARVLYGYLAAQPSHCLPVGTIEAAAALGVTLPPPRLMMAPWRYVDAHREPTPTAQTLDDLTLIAKPGSATHFLPDQQTTSRPILLMAVKNCIDPHEAAAIAIAIDQARRANTPLPFILAEIPDHLRGSPLLEPYRVLRHCRVVARDADGEIDLDPSVSDQRIATSIELHLSTSESDPLPPVILSTTAALYEAIDNDLDMVAVVHLMPEDPTERRQLVADLETLLFNATFSYSSAIDSGSYEDFAAEHHRNCERFASMLVLGDAVTRMAEARAEIVSVLPRIRDAGLTRVTITLGSPENAGDAYAITGVDAAGAVHTL